MNTFGKTTLFAVTLAFGAGLSGASQALPLQVSPDVPQAAPAIIEVQAQGNGNGGRGNGDRGGGNTGALDLRSPNCITHACNPPPRRWRKPRPVEHDGCSTWQALRSARAMGLRAAELDYTSDRYIAVVGTRYGYELRLVMLRKTPDCQVRSLTRL